MIIHILKVKYQVWLDSLTIRLVASLRKVQFWIQTTKKLMGNDSIISLNNSHENLQFIDRERFEIIF